MERAFQISAVVLIGAAAIFFLKDNFDGVFISTVLACLSFFLSVRTQVKGRLKARELELLAEQGEEDKCNWNDEIADLRKPEPAGERADKEK